MKKITAILLAVSVLLAIVGCSINIENGSASENDADAVEAVPAESYLGNWVDVESGKTSLTIEAGAEGNYNASVITEGGETYAMTAQYSDSCLSYTGDGQSEKSGGLFSYDASTGELTWTQIKILDSLDDMNDISAIINAADDPVATTVFRRAGSADDEEKMNSFVGSWYCDRVSLDITRDGDDFKALVAWGSSADEHTTWEYACYFDGENLVSFETGEKTIHHFGENDQETVEVVYSDGAVSFSIGENGKLTWEDFKENAGEGLEFEKAEG